MIWNVDGYEVEVLITGGLDVQVCRWDNSNKIIYVPGAMSNDEVRWIIRNIQQKGGHAPHQKYYAELDIFGRVWPVILRKGTGKSYLSGNMIFCFTNRSVISNNFKIHLKQQLLDQLLLFYVSTWEDRLDKLVPQIGFRKQDRHPFIIDKKASRISFDKRLHRFELMYIEYCVFDALTLYFGIDESQKQSYEIKYFTSAKAIQKTLAYEYR
ncbi:MAG: hypothetical protein ACTIJ8_13210 [Sphingobacterium sp.]